MRRIDNKLYADVGMILTDDEIYSGRIFLGCNDSEENYHEITLEEYAMILAEQNMLEE